MKNKILVNIYVPLIDREFDIYIPVIKKAGTCKNLIANLIEEETEGIFKNDGCKKLYDRITGEKIDDQMYIKYSNVQNGSRLILF